MKRVYIENLREGSKVEDIFLVASKTVASTRTGKPFLKLRLADKTGQVDAVKWDVTESEIGRFSEQDYVQVRASVNTYQDNPQLSIESLQQCMEAIDPADFIRSSSRHPEDMMPEFRSLLKSISDSRLTALLDSLFGNENFCIKFCQAPGAKSIHHACIGGLLEHTLNVMKTCVALADLYPQVDRDMLLAGAALHDIGKVEEYVWNGAIAFSDAGHLVGHIVGGAMMVKEAADRIPGFDPVLNLALQHMILAHHGTKEFGSPKQPKSIEAMMLNHADDLDAKVAIYEQAIKDSDGNGENGLFTKKHFILERPIFKGVPTQAEISPLGSPADDDHLDIFAVEESSDPFAD